MFAVASHLYLCVWYVLSHNMIVCPFCWSQLWCTHPLGSKPPQLPLPILRMVICCWGFWLRIFFDPSFLRTLQRYQFLVRALGKVTFSSWKHPVLLHKGESTYLAYNPRLQSITEVKSRLALEGAGRFPSQGQGESMLACSLCSVPSRHVHCSRPKPWEWYHLSWMSLPVLIKLIKTIPHRHNHRPTRSRQVEMILGCVKSTIKTKHHILGL